VHVDVEGVVIAFKNAYAPPFTLTSSP
jgi:hypothetical protein